MFFPAPGSLAINVVIVQFIKLSCHIASDDLTGSTLSVKSLAQFFYIHPVSEKYENWKKKMQLGHHLSLSLFLK